MIQPFSYYGGKQRMAANIVGLLPEHKIYVELFCGGASVFFNKTASDTEVLNDTNGMIINFFRVLKNKTLYLDLKHKLEYTLYSQDEYRLAKSFLSNTKLAPIDLAWAWFVCINFSFANKIGGGFGFSKDSRTPRKIRNKIDQLDQTTERLKHVYLFNDSYSKLIKRFDSDDTVFYADPPYPDTNQGHYKGFAQADFDQMIADLSGCCGNVVLSCYQNKSVPESWEQQSFQSTSSANLETNNSKRTEMVFIKRRHL